MLLLTSLFGNPAEKAIFGEPSEANMAIPGPPRLILPPIIHALPGIETNVYFENASLLLDPRSVAPDVSCSKGAQQNSRWTWAPKEEDLGVHALMLELRDAENAVTARAYSVVSVHPRKPVEKSLSPASLLIIGDSLTAASIYPGRVLELAKEDAWPLRLIGTRGPGAEEGKELGEVRHEGYGGWTAERFATHAKGKARSGGPTKECASPFLYVEGEGPQAKLDFSRYYAEFNDGKAPDFVTILLGCNDTFRGTDENIEELIGNFVKHTETLLAEIRKAGPDTRIGLLLPMPPAASQDAFGANYGSGQTRWQYLRNRHRVVERMMEHFSGREGEGIDLVPAHLNLDPVHGFPSARQAAHAHNPTEIERQNNGVHPSPAGYRQLGDALYAWLRSHFPPPP